LPDKIKLLSYKQYLIYSVRVNSNGRAKFATSSVSSTAATQDIDKYQHNDEMPNFVDIRSAVLGPLHAYRQKDGEIPTLQNTVVSAFTPYELNI
jgi:hypothetical protein